MTERLSTPRPETLAKIRSLAARSLTPEEVRAALAAPISEAEREATKSLAAWFRRRYPTPAARLAYVRRAWRRWSARLA